MKKLGLQKRYSQSILKSSINYYPIHRYIVDGVHMKRMEKMIIERTKNLLNTKAPIIAHQVNCQGIMGAGVARVIRENLLSIEEYRKYQDACKRPAKELLGNCMFSATSEGFPDVVNLFAEDEPTGKRVDTDYHALKRCFMGLVSYCKKQNIHHVAIPGYIGCGLAGGDWNHVYSYIICPIFEKGNILLEIDYLPQSTENLFRGLMSIADPLEDMWHGFPSGTSKALVEAYLVSSFCR